MTTQPLGASIVTRFAYGVIGLACLASVTTACSGTTKIAQSSLGHVYLEEVTDWSFEASHPAIIDQTTLLKAIKGLYSDEIETGTSKMSAGGRKPMRIFSDEDAEFLAPLLAQGLSKAKPEQLVGFRVSSSAGSGSEPTSGSLYVQKGSIYVTITKGVMPTGFMPESVARTQSAPGYASGILDNLTIVIDYRALAKAPMVSLPVAKAAPKPAVIPAASTGSATTQPANALPVSRETTDIDKVKETIAKKDSEIKMLRKEADWMKRELRERDEEIKALRGSKVSAKPTPKKKHAQASPTPPAEAPGPRDFR